jgi:SAM-dependent methyltransferase
MERPRPRVFDDDRRGADLMTIDEPGYFERLARVEAGHWWPRAMWRLASDWLGGAIRGRRGLEALDIGCGAGLSLIRLAGHREIGRVVGLEPDPGALRLARLHRGFEIIEGSALDLPFECGSFDVVTCFDVLQHLPDGGDRVAACEMARVLRPGGVAVVRSNSAGFGPGRTSGGSSYRLRELVELLENAGFSIRRASYANGLPGVAQEVRGRLRFVAGARGRHWRAHPSGGGLRLDVPTPWVNRMMGGVSAIERRAAALIGGGLPFGHSTMVLAGRAGGDA